MARPSEYDPKLCAEICDQIRQGGSIKNILKKKRKYPTFQTWCNWKRDNIELFDQYIRAIQDKSETCIENIHDTLEKMSNDELDPKKARLIIDTNKWLAGKFYPKMFGTNSTIDVTTNGKEIQQQVTVFKLPDNNRDNKTD